MNTHPTSDSLAYVSIELSRALKAHPPMASAHEGYAVILEEVEELWAEIKRDKRDPAKRLAAMRREAVQVAAMGTRFLIDVQR
jgi:hypothetical protein